MNQSDRASKKPHQKYEALNSALVKQALEVVFGFLVEIEYESRHTHQARSKCPSTEIRSMAKWALDVLSVTLPLLPDSSQSSPILRRTKRTPARVQAAFLPSNSNTSTTPVASAGHPFVLNESNIERTLQTIREKLLDTSAPIVVLDPAHRNQKSSGRKHR